MRSFFRLFQMKLRPAPKVGESRARVTILAITLNMAMWFLCIAAVGHASEFSSGLFTEDERRFWAFQPIEDPPVPPVENGEWADNPLDRFILAPLERHDLRPALCADRPTLLRRVTFGLTGLPPTPREVDAFLKDTAPQAYARVVDRLLASPTYGERWGRYWLDIARYADNNGASGNFAYRFMYRYRDYVVHAFNSDKSYRQFVLEQMAGDLMADRVDPGTRAERIIATGFLMGGPKPLYQQDKAKMMLDIVDEQIDTTGRAFLALTLGCARCHNHKFDPIPTMDYYSLAGIFFSTQTMADRKLLASKWMEWPLEMPGYDEPQKVMAVQDGEATTLRVHLRGEANNLGPPAPRGFLQIIAGEGHNPQIAADASGRRELAEWIASPENPLTARVLVNRIWQEHFGRGLVATSDNFGRLGERPSHPHLLDWLASRFIESGWSIKAIHRLIVSSKAYRMQSSHPDELVEPEDRENRLLGRMSARRLTVEEIRDAMLAIGGRLDRTLGGSLFDYSMRYLDEVQDSKRELFDLGLGGKTYHPYYSNRRTVYLPVIRGALPDFLQAFDFADPYVSTSRRSQTTVAPQALLLMNHPFVAEQSLALARDLVRAHEMSEDERLARAHFMILGRPPTEFERRQSQTYVRRCRALLGADGRLASVGYGQGTAITINLKRAPHPFRGNGPKIGRMRLRLAVTAEDLDRSRTNEDGAWSILEPVYATATGDIRLPLGADRTVTIDKETATAEEFTITVRSTTTGIRALRLEVLQGPDERPERYSIDQLNLWGIRVTAAPWNDESPNLSNSATTRPIVLQRAFADYPESFSPALALIDGDRTTAWPIGPPVGQGAHTVYLEAEEPELVPLRSYCQMLFCSNEFLYVH